MPGMQRIMVISICDACGVTGKYNKQFDSYYCEDCNIWINNFCQDVPCDFYINRPKTPNLLEDIDSE